MCGIIGYVGEREAQPILLEGLRRLEYRGYDSAGLALPRASPLLAPVLAAIPLQLLAHHVAVRRGCEWTGRATWPRA